MKPVEIEFLMKDKLSGGIDSARMKADLLDASLKKIALTIGSVFTVGKAIEFGKVMMDVRGQIESFQISFETLIGNKDRANAFFSELKQFSTETPLALDSLSQSAQTFLGFGVETERIIPILKQIGDVTMGNKERFGAMSLAFAQMYAAGKLMGQDLLQMINAGFNPLKVISEKTGKSISRLKDEMSQGAISAEMVADAFKTATSEGGKFHGMLEKQSQGIQGMKASFSSAVTDMMNELGGKSQELYTSGISMATSLVKNYETVGKVLVGLIATYGTYRVALMLAIECEKGYTLATALKIKGLIAAEKAQKLLNATMMKNPYVLLTVGVIALASAMWAFHDSATPAEKAQKRLNDELTRSKEKKEALISRTDELINKINDETLSIYEQTEAWKELQKELPGVFKGLSTEEALKLAKNPEEVKKRREAEREQEDFSDAEQKVKDAQKKVADLEKELSEEYGRDRRVTLGFLLRDAKLDAQLAEKTFAQMNKTRTDAWLNSRTDEEKIIQYNNSLKKLIQERQALDKELTRPLIVTKDENGNEVKRLTDLERIQKAAQLKAIESRIAETKSNLNALQPKTDQSQNKAYWEEQKKNAESARNALDPNNAETKKAWDEYTKIIRESDKALETWSMKSQARNEKDTARLRLELDERRKRIEEYEKELARQMQDAAFEREQGAIDVMDDGLEKQTKQLDLNYRKLIEENKRLEEQWVKELQGKERTEWEMKNPDHKEKGIVFTPKSTAADLSENQKKAIADKNTAAWDEMQKRYGDLLNSMLKDSEGFEKKQLAINKKYDELQRAADIKYAAEKGEEYKKVTEEINRQRQEETDANAVACLEQSEAYKNLTRVIMEEGRAALKIQLQRLEEYLKEVERVCGKESEEYKKTQKDIANAKKALNKDTVQSFQEVAEIMNMIVSNIGETNDKFVKTAATIANSAMNIYSAFQSENTAQGVGGIIQGILAITASIRDWRYESLEIYDPLKEQAETYNQIANSVAATNMHLEYQKSLLDNTTGTNALRDKFDLLQAYGEQERQAWTDLQNLGIDYIDSKKEVYKDSGNKFLKILGGAFNPVAAVANLINGDSEIEAKGANKFGMGLMSGFQAETYEKYNIKTIDTSNFNDIKQYRDLLIDIIKNGGKYNGKEVAESDISTLKLLIETYDEAQKKQQELREDMANSIIGDLGGQLKNALVDAFKAGEDASKKMFDAASESMGKFLEDALFAEIFSKQIAAFKSDLIESFSNEGDGNVTDDFERFFDELPVLQAQFNEAMEAYQKLAEERGFDVWQDTATTQQGKAGAYQAASQDSITRLEGLYSSMLEHSIHIDGSVENIAEGMSVALGHLQKIEENTGHLSGIKKAIETMKDDIYRIRMDGIKAL